MANHAPSSQNNAAVALLGSLPGQPLRLTADSRKVQPGDVFFAYPIGKGDGRRHIRQALDQGAAAIIHEAQDFKWQESGAVPHVAVTNLLWESGHIAAQYFGRPDTGMFVAAVTGTNGKTSCTNWIARALSLCGTPSTIIGTLGVARVVQGRVGEFDETGFTTPDAIQLQQTLSTLRQSGCGAIAIEASSIGLDQGRMNGMHVDVAVLTNLTRDHLDYHGDMASYELAKRKLFDWPGLQACVINLDDPAGERLLAHCRSRSIRVFGYVIDCPDAAQRYPGVELLQASGLRNQQGGTTFMLETPHGSALVKTQMIGRFNVSNVLAVFGTLLAKGIAPGDAIKAVEQLTPVAGRMELLGAPGRVLVVVDYAHTPDALEKTLQNLKEVAQERQGRLWCVFGCGGDRDPGKRPAMGKIAELADEIVVTSDNPRSEDPERIIADIVAGFTPGRMPAPATEADRGKAILYAIKNAGKNDVVLLAGKGHEAYQEIKGKKLLFSDIDHANIALADLASKGAGL